MTPTSNKGFLNGFRDKMEKLGINAIIWCGFCLWVIFFCTSKDILVATKVALGNTQHLKLLVQAGIDLFFPTALCNMEGAGSEPVA